MNKLWGFFGPFKKMEEIDFNPGQATIWIEKKVEELKKRWSERRKLVKKERRPLWDWEDCPAVQAFFWLKDKKEDFLEKSFDIVDIVEDVLFIYKQQILMHGIELEIDYVEKYHYLKSHPTYLKQILMNIIANAKDELINVKQLDLSFHAKIKIIIVEEANQYIINVEDNGRGISEEKKEHIFEPFFTTKGNDGMGMGLYLCKLLFENKMQGDIVLSNLSNPTKFSILLFK